MESIVWLSFLLLFISVSGYSQDDPFKKIYSIKKGRVTGPDGDYRNFTLVKDQGDSLMFQRNYSPTFYPFEKGYSSHFKKRNLIVGIFAGAAFGSLETVIGHANFLILQPQAVNGEPSF
ncbi:MAG: hypothetical protein R2784_17145 [Saprospiraceae bacterium]